MKYRVKIVKSETQFADVVALDETDAEFYAIIGANLSEKTEPVKVTSAEVQRVIS